MKEILIFAGTTEGRLLSECLARAGIVHTVCVATEYGELVLKENPAVTVRRGRMDSKEMAAFIRKGHFAAVVDATHPYAVAVTGHIREAAQETKTRYLRLKRRTERVGEDADQNPGIGTAESGEEADRISYFNTVQECAAALENTKGNILLTTGTKDLSAFCTSDGLKSRIYARVLPGLESIRACIGQGISGRQILALQGPFTADMNEAMIRQYQIRCLVTKASGRAGGFPEKLLAAQKAGISVFVIGSHEDDPGYSFREVLNRLEEICERKIPDPCRMEIVLAGVGMGSGDGLTEEVRRVIAQADILLGAARMIAPYHPRMEKRPYYRAEQILPYLMELREDPAGEPLRVAVLFSGDSGCYSGCQTLYRALQEQIRTGALPAEVRILPGISAVSYLAARIGESYQDAAIYSMHGKKLANLAGKIRREEKTWLLMSGAEDVRTLGQALIGAGLDHCEVTVGYQLSYPEESVRTLTPRECVSVAKEGLYICLVRNPVAAGKSLSHGKKDSEFIREKVPMTREEVREVSICKLGLTENAVVYDIGAGTGSVSIEIAGLSDSIQVYAVERREDAVRLIERNKEKFGLDNISVVATEAPDGLKNLPAPTHVLIGGSGGRLEEILAGLCRFRCRIRVVIHAVTMETVCQIRRMLTLFEVEGEDIVQLQVSRARRAGEYRLMTAENPVWICAFDLKGEKAGLDQSQ